jgi:hypothetical protein
MLPLWQTLEHNHLLEWAGECGDHARSDSWERRLTGGNIVVKKDFTCVSFKVYGRSDRII